MSISIRIILLLFLLFTLTSCGADKLKTKTVTNQFGITSNEECPFNTTGPPVCGLDLKNYLNKEHAVCAKTTVAHIGHCVCSDEVIVCGSDGVDYKECEAQNQKIEIAKYIPCAAKEY